MNANFNPVVLMVVIPLIAGLLCVALVNWIKVSRAITAVGFGTTFTLAVVWLGVAESRGGLLVAQMGGWAAPHGISLIFDSLSGLMLAAASLVALCTSLYAFGSVPWPTERRYFWPMVNLMMMGVNLSFLTGDLFNLFVSFEIMLMASYGLLVIGGGRAQLGQAYKYVLLNLLASAIFVIAAGMTYGMFGTLNLADLARLVGELARRDQLPIGFNALAVLLLFVFTLKAGVFPLWFWLPDTYPTCPIAVAGLFGGVLTKVGLYAVARTFTLIFVQEDSGGVLIAVLALGAGLTMLIGVLGALAYTRMRRVLCLLLMLGVGYALLGITVMSEGSLAGAAFYMAQSMPLVAGLFLACGLLERRTGTDDTGKFGALMQRPGTMGLGIITLVLLLGAVGLPPLPGFYGKLVIVREALGQGFVVVGAIALLVGGLTLLAALRVWGNSFWGPPLDNPADSPTATPLVGRTETTSWGERIGTWTLVLATLALGVWPEPALRHAAAAGRQLAEPTPYIRAVLDNPAYAGPDLVKATAPAPAYAYPPTAGQPGHGGDGHD